jgi:hypothetical protein
MGHQIYAAQLAEDRRDGDWTQTTVCRQKGTIAKSKVTKTKPTKTENEENDNERINSQGGILPQKRGIVSRRESMTSGLATRTTMVCP